jgi:hypothetical protein
MEDRETTNVEAAAEFERRHAPPSWPEDEPDWRDLGDDWRCECGDLNREHEAFCYRCGAGAPEECARCGHELLRSEGPLCSDCEEHR